MSELPGLIIDQASLDHAVRQLQLLDGTCIESMLAVAGPPPLRRREAGLAGLVRIIISQQVSTASADAIHRRYCERFETAGTADLMAASDADFQACGLSLPKIRTLRHLAAAINEGRLDLDALSSLDPAGVHQALTAIKGIGPWTAGVYLLFCLGHPDVWPAGDLALQEGVRLGLNLKKRPDAGRLEKISKRWKPWRAVAARIIWAYYGACRANTAMGPNTRRPTNSLPVAKK
ncbi:MAG: DNA-3-methyladenine glycosylase 2 family protein [Beijerinckiaceae bacterium]|jgi:DNA-3-methyladenine glycosylase II|nr:DNA-3-methyladenine glycosylase 2 family protein [Beijerinckiaceae bacterium]